MVNKFVIGKHFSLNLCKRGGKPTNSFEACGRKAQMYKIINLRGTQSQALIKAAASSLDVRNQPTLMLVLL